MGAAHESVARLQAALAIQRRIGDRLGEVVTQTNLVTAYYDLGAWDRLIETAEAVLPRNEAQGNRYSAAYVRHLQGLAALALGDYEAARRLFGQAERDFEAVDNHRAAGLARNALGLVAEAEGELDEALRLYQAALKGAEALQAMPDTAIAQHDLGALLVRLERPAEAIPLLRAAQDGWTEQADGLARLRNEAVLGLARLATGARAEAEALAARGWAALGAGLPPGEQPQAWLWALHQLLRALGQPERAGQALRAAYAELQRQAQALGEVGLRRSFFERVPLNRAIVAAHGELQAAARVRTVTLARRGAPLGRALRPDERVSVRWTVAAPEDEAILGKGARRQHRLRRLLAEAESQAAAPTDDDLARALGVSRRTILRDMRAIAAQVPVPATRKRR
jgi:tetratricopeptide (TPR) repeat protein